MKRLTHIFLLALTFFAILPEGVAARGIDPVADSLAIVNMRKKMDIIREVRPTVALVLSGGGAKGAAHIGVIRYVESLGIPVDMVLGTSMGGLVGGIYALGYDVDQMEALVKSIDWNTMLTDKLPREYISYKYTKYREKYMLSIPFFYDKDYFKMRRADEYRFDPVAQMKETLHFGSDREKSNDLVVNNLLGSLPSGFIYGQQVTNLISSLTVGYQDSTDFSTFPIPFACIAADMVSGKAKIWHSGCINDALRSTMSIPGIFAPVRIDGMVLVDGGLRDNYPTALAREMGADIIIGVDLSQQRKTFTQINNIGDIINQGIDMLGMDTFEKNVQIPDVKIKPDLKEFNMMSFTPENIDTIIVRGYNAAVAQDSLLREVAKMTSRRFVKTPKPSAVYFQKDSVSVTDVEVAGLLPKERELLKKKMNFKYGQKISHEELNNMVAQIYGTNTYDYVTYKLLGKQEPYKLQIDCRQGPIHQFGLGVRADTEEIVSVLLNLGYNTHKLYGHTLDLSGKVSANPYVTFRWSYDSPKFTTVNASVSARWTDLNMLNLGDNRLSLSFLNCSQNLYLSNLNWKLFAFESGIRNEYIHIKNIKATQFIGDYDFAQLQNDFISLYAKAGADTFDNGYFPTKGFTAGVSYSWTFAGFPNRFNNFHTVNAYAKVVVPFWNVFSFIPSFNIRFLLGSEIPVAYFNSIGGSMASRYIDQQMPFVGITNLTATGNILTVFRTDYRVRIAKNHYITGILNYARDSNTFKEYVSDKLGYFGAALEYSFDSIFGPISFDVHWSNITNKAGVYIRAGYDF